MSESVKSRINTNIILKIIFGIIIMCIGIQHILKIYQPTLLDDEYCYWSIAAYLNGKDWSSVTALCNYYSYGYSFILFLIMKITNNTVWMYRIAVVINAALLTGSFYLLDNILSEMQTKMKNASANKCTVIAFLTILIPCNINYASVNLTECLLLFLSLVLLKFISNVKDNQSYLYMASAAVVCGYAYMVHQRMLCVIIGVLATLIIMTIRKEINISKVLVFAITLAVMFIIHLFLKGEIKQAVWNGLNANVVKKTGAVNDYGSIVGNIKYIFSEPANFIRFIIGGLGKIYYYLSATYLIGGLALIIMLKKCISKFNEIYFFLTTSFIMLLGLASVFMGKLDTSGLSPLVYGRYMEVLYPPILAIGLIYLSECKKDSIKNKLLTILSVVSVYGVVGIIVRMYIKRRELKVLNYISCGQIYKYMSGENLPVLKMMLVVAVTFIALMLIKDIKNKRKIVGCLVAIVVFVMELRTAYVPFSDVNLWLQDNKKCAKEMIDSIGQTKGNIYYYISDTEEKQSGQNREYIQYWYNDRAVFCVDEDGYKKLKMNSEDVIVVSDKYLWKQFDEDNSLKSIYSTEDFVKVYKDNLDI